MTEAIWHGGLTLAELARSHHGTLPEYIGIEFTDLGPDWLQGRMPVDHRTVQPYGVVHGGASVVLAETLGSLGAAWSVDRTRFRALGQEVNANHLRPVTSGWVTGVARPFRRGRRSHVWGIELTDEAGKLTCVARLTVAIVEIPAG